MTLPPNVVTPELHEPEPRARWTAIVTFDDAFASVSYKLVSVSLRTIGSSEMAAKRLRDAIPKGARVRVTIEVDGPGEKS